ncbi:unnamed protein product [Rhizophagus irregularis]|uniref:Uncharacterized protein n=1 Tax=Rhizophagus irregularis TaxID=588596 RepID=A0A2N1N2W2_9GLOM|nr:hypothetical protein RhiirC2_713560 [Rhizophagus irregularis]CAB5322857.1 unnamed protein product [Rhizophagus irregularis]
MITNKIFKTYFLIFFLFVFLFYQVDAKCENINSDLTSDGNWNYDDTYYLFGGGIISLNLTEMPCGASNLSILVQAEDGGGGYKPRNFTNDDLGKRKPIGENINAKTEHQFRIQALVVDFKNITCSDPHFKGNLCYSDYIESIDCTKERSVAIGVPIATAVIGVLGGIGGVLLKQYFDRRNGSSGP